MTDAELAALDAWGVYDETPTRANWHTVLVALDSLEERDRQNHEQAAVQAGINGGWLDAEDDGDGYERELEAARLAAASTESAER